jgi:hypothetical protein
MQIFKSPCQARVEEFAKFILIVKYGDAAKKRPARSTHMLLKSGLNQRFRIDLYKTLKGISLDKVESAGFYQQEIQFLEHDATNGLSGLAILVSLGAVIIAVFFGSGAMAVAWAVLGYLVISVIISMLIMTYNVGFAFFLRAALKLVIKNRNCQGGELAP